MSITSATNNKVAETQTKSFHGYCSPGGEIWTRLNIGNAHQLLFYCTSIERCGTRSDSCWFSLNPASRQTCRLSQRRQNWLRRAFLTKTNRDETPTVQDIFSFLAKAIKKLQIEMDSSSDAMMANMTSRRGTCKGVVNPPSILRSSRSMEHRSPCDAQLQRFPLYREENMGLDILVEEQSEDHGPKPLSPSTAAERRPAALQFANHLSGRDVLADFYIMETKQAVKNHIIMLNL